MEDSILSIRKSRDKWLKTHCPGLYFYVKDSIEKHIESHGFILLQLEIELNTKQLDFQQGHLDVLKAHLIDLGYLIAVRITRSIKFETDFALIIKFV